MPVSQLTCLSAVLNNARVPMCLYAPPIHCGAIDKCCPQHGSALRSPRMSRFSIMSLLPESMHAAPLFSVVVLVKSNSPSMGHLNRGVVNEEKVNPKCLHSCPAKSAGHPAALLCNLCNPDACVPAFVGKLFPGPHLYAGAGIVVLWALASAMVPYMAKGSEVARTVHITLNFLNLGLFAWQIPTGLEIVQKVWANVAWP